MISQYINKADAIAEIEKRLHQYEKEYEELARYEIWITAKEIEHKIKGLKEALSILDTLEVKEAIEYKQPEYSYFETVYQCGKKPRWNIGDTLAYYEFCTDREGEHVLGKVTKADFDKEEYDWFYTFENGSVCSEQSLLEDETYKKN